MTEFEFTDRYKAMGIDYPDPKTTCFSCEGTGRVPVASDEEEERYQKLWKEAEERKHAADGWHFVVCPDCNGTGKRTADDWQLEVAKDENFENYEIVKKIDPSKRKPHSILDDLKEGYRIEREPLNARVSAADAEAADD